MHNGSYQACTKQSNRCSSSHGLRSAAASQIPSLGEAVGCAPKRLAAPPRVQADVHHFLSGGFVRYTAYEVRLVSNAL
jgi:hypothetical protein